jgi:hypothetical protein
VSRGGEHAHVGAGFGDEHIGDDVGEAWDAHEQFPDGLKRGDRRLDAGIQAGEVGVMGVDAVQVEPHHEGMVVVEPSAQRLGQGGNLLA